MSDIFISYASVDRERAKVVAEALAARGLSVWWDRVIPPGRQFDEVIEEALDAARCVVVLWSQASTQSTWVKTEAAEAMRGKALIPAIIEEGVRIPLEFRRLQAADLSHWRGAPAPAPAPAQSAQGVQSPQSAQGVPAAGVLNLKWRDSALGFSGALTWSPSNALIRAAVIDLRTGTHIGNYAVPAMINQQGTLDYVVSADFAVPGDSTTPGPHTHTSRLLVRAQPDGSLRFLQNCPRPGECY